MSGSPPARAAATAGDLPDPEGGGSVVDRARRLLAYLAVPGRTPLELAQAREIRAALTLEARLVGAMATKSELHEHPDFEAWAERLVKALVRVPGALDELDAFLASPADDRRVAA
jgi:hypothetical protein